MFKSVSVFRAANLSCRLTASLCLKMRNNLLCAVLHIHTTPTEPTTSSWTAWVCIPRKLRCYSASTGSGWTAEPWPSMGCAASESWAAEFAQRLPERLRKDEQRLPPPGQLTSTLLCKNTNLWQNNKLVQRRGKPLSALQPSAASRRRRKHVWKDTLT